MPTYLVKEYLDVLTSAVTKVDKKSLSLAVFSRTMKVSLVKPLTKDNRLEYNIQNNYRPVSNLTFLSNVIEKRRDFFLSKYLVNDSLNELLYAGYNKSKSTEIAMFG
jgi:hypothetical protein